MPAWRPVREVFQLPPEFGSAAAAIHPDSSHAPRDEGPPPPLKFRFTGTWLGYYRVWIVGVILTVLTLGLYAPWAKVRNKRYLYAHTRLGDDGFHYRADPRRILVGNLIVAGLFAFWFFSRLITPWLPFALMALGLLALPWVISRALRFNARATVWRGLRFGFTGGMGGCLRVFFLLPLACLGVFWPAVARAQRRWLVENHHYGGTPFGYHTSLWELYGIYLKSLVFFAPAGLCYLGVIVNTYAEQASARSPDGMVWLPFWLINIATVGPQILPFTLPVALGGMDFLRARLFTCHWNGTTLGDHVFHAYMGPWEVFKLRLLHTAATVFSLGLLWPWVKIHNHVFTLDCIDLSPARDLGSHVAVASGADRAGAIGDSANDFLDLEIGL